MFEFQFLDKRVQRTKSDLYNSLFQLLEQQPFEHITIKDIVENAGYSRGVFYKHYRNKEQLLDEIIDYLFTSANAAIRTTYKHKNLINVHEFTNEPIYLLQHFQTYGWYYQILLKRNIDGAFSTRIAKEIIATFIKDFQMSVPHYDAAFNETLNKYYAYALTGLIVDWILDDFPKSAQEFAEELVKVFQHTLSEIHIIK